MSNTSRRRAPTTATARLRQDYMRLMRDPVPYVFAEPLPSNILEWHYCVKGPEKSPYEGGYYHGKLVFPSNFPFQPPKILMITPNGRFKTNMRLCLSISDYHPDTWNPAWSVSTILTGLLSFMLEDSPTMGSVTTSLKQKRSLALLSGTYNLENPTFCELFPEICEEIKEKEKERQANVSQEPASESAPETEKSVCSVAGNMAVILGFIAFAWTVRQVLIHVAS